MTPFLRPDTTHDVAVVVHPADGGLDVTTYVAFDVVTAPQLNVTAAFNDDATAAVGTVSGTDGTTVVVAAGPVPSLLVPSTEMVYVVPFVNPLMRHELPPLLEHVAFPGVATAVYTIPA